MHRQPLFPTQGASRQGFENNFTWGVLNITGQSLDLQDGNTETAGEAFYAGEILGAAISGDQVTNIFGHGLNVYYEPLLAGNAYLGGLSYWLQDGGRLAPVMATPLPGSVWLLLSSLGGLAVVQRWRRRG